eukprot:CAMPEP_0206537772 /NCGR_PEP_ID=MMETSP0325_2-20121206/7496_1 /ASSEMBLY_ACC=CAM_ASM_000347 /TAXON_ID=2866 /ORGANISM="Crypthecodinium cohnii, Strain Seligo" /LENGTH=334 /DNA_ID=CAMNT_0054035143 /DNA_START=52 /DNA_END=1056 /DNA_ORIENTATION=+
MALVCANCSNSAVAECSGCYRVCYCSPQCQRAHWGRHKEACLQATVQNGRTGTSSSSTAEVDDSCPSFGAGPDARIAGPITTKPAPYDVYLAGERSVAIAQNVVDCLKAKGLCIVKAGADSVFTRALLLEANQLWKNGSFQEAHKGRPDSVRSGEVHYDVRDDKVVWFSSQWMQEHEKSARALKVLEGQLGDFGLGLNKLLEEQLGLSLRRRSCGMLSCYDGDSKPGARYDFHVDNPYMTSMEVPDDKRRLTLVYYINEPDWDVDRDGGALQVCLSNPRKAPRTTAEAMKSERVTVAPTCDTMAVFFSHTMYHAVLPVTSNRRRFALSTWFQCP